MSKVTSFNLGGHFNDFIGAQIELGRFGSASEVVRAGLRMLEDHEQKVHALRTALEEGENTPFVKNYSIKDVIHQLDNEK